MQLLKDKQRLITLKTVSKNVNVTKLAQGLPVGGEIENLDDGTLFSAFKNRTGIKSSSD